MGQTILEMKGIDKKFGNIQVLFGVDFTLHEGEIKGLIGENGAGKSTLMKILTGEYQKTAGEIVLFGKPTEIAGPKHAISLGVSMVYQELNNAPDMTIAENMFIGRELKKKGFADKKEMNRKAKEYLESFGLDFSPTRRMRDLSVSEMQMVEIAKIVSYQSKIIVMDEPTSSITRAETQKLFTMIRKLKEMGIGIIYISHKLDELFELTDTIAVMRDGYMVHTDKTENMKEDDLIRLMVGREIEDIFPPKNETFGDVIFEVEHLSRKGEFEDVSFCVRRGEILGFAGLVGAGRTETMMTLFGDRKRDGGTVKINGKTMLIKSPVQSVAHKIALIPEDRKLYGLDLISSVSDNIEFVVEKENSKFGFFLNAKKKKADAEEMVEKLSIKCSSLLQPAMSLSGGNQQKIVLAKWLLSDPDIIILDEPTRGIDIGAKIEIYKIINKLALSGKAVILVSSELNEIIGLSNRVVVMYEGKITGELSGDEMEQENIMSYAHAYNNGGGEQ